MAKQTLARAAQSLRVKVKCKTLKYCFANERTKIFVEVAQVMRLLFKAADLS